MHCLNADNRLLNKKLNMLVKPLKMLRQIYHTNQVRNIPKNQIIFVVKKINQKCTKDFDFVFSDCRLGYAVNSEIY